MKLSNIPAWIRGIFVSRPQRELSRRLHVECLEDRVQPATFSTVGTTLTINLTNVNEAVSLSTDGTHITVLSNFNAVDGGGNGGNVTGFLTNTALVTSGAYTDINIIDTAAGTSVNFAASAGSFAQNFNITLDDASSGNITISGATTDSGNFAASTANGTISSSATGSLAITGSLSLTGGTNSRNILMLGSVSVTTTTTLNGLAVQVDNPANNFGGAVSIVSTSFASIADANDLVLGACTFGTTTFSQPTTRITAGGNITQTAGITSSANEMDVTSTGGNITLTDPTNQISRLGLSVTGSHTASVFSLNGLILGNVTAGTGAVTLATSNGTLSQATGLTIKTGGALNVNANAGAVNVMLDQANRIVGAVTIAEAGGDLNNVSFRNTADNATMPTIAALATADDIVTLTVRLDNNGIVLPAIFAPTNAVLTAGGNISEAGVMTLSGALTATVLGDFGINFNAINIVAGAVSLNAPDSTQAIAVTVSGNLNLGASSIGRGAFTAVATGNISSSGAIVQAKGAAAANFSSGGTTVSLNANNDFTGNVVVAGPTVAALAFTNIDAAARFSQLSFPTAPVSALNYASPNAAVVLPTLTIANLNVTGNGIFQQSGSSLTIAGVAFFNAGPNSLFLNGANNFGGTLSLNTVGLYDVSVNDINAVQLTTSNLGTGRLTITAGGDITQQAGTTITQTAGVSVGAITLTSTGNITLDQANILRGRVNATVSGTKDLLINDNSDLQLGNITTGVGTTGFTAKSVTVISQFPGTKLTLGGASSFQAPTVSLNNKGNSFAGPIALSASTVSLTSAGALVFGPCTITTSLTATSGGGATHSITQNAAITTPLAVFNAGAGDIVLTNAGNNFGEVRLTSTGTVSVTDAGDLAIGASKLGGTFTVIAGGSVTTGTGAIVQTGSGAISITTPGAGDVTLNAANRFLGTVTIVHSSNVNLRSIANLSIVATSPITGSLTATAGGTLTLPTDLTQLDSLTIDAGSTTISSDITLSTSDLNVAGTVNFTGTRIVTVMNGNAFFTGNVNVGGALTIAVASGDTVQHLAGTWNQGSNDLTINGTSADLTLGSTDPERFIMSGGSINMSGGGAIAVLALAVFQVGSVDASAETVTINDAGGDLTFNPGAVLQVGVGATNDQLIYNGTGSLDVDGAVLRTTGLADLTNATPVLTANFVPLTGRFAGTVDGTGAATDVFTGSDIVTPSYSATQLMLKSGGVVSGTGTATGFLPDGDNYTVKTTLGAAGKLVTLVDAAGNLDVVVRNTTAAIQTLTISTTGGGDGVLPVNGIMVHSTGATTIVAGMADITGQLTTKGTLTLTARDLGAASPLLLSAGGPVAGLNKVTARELENVTANFTGMLSSLTVVAADANAALITADKFGTIVSTGSAALGEAGDFNARLTSTTAGTGQVLFGAAIAGTLGGTWDLGGTVGTVRTAATNAWTLGTVPGSDARNGGLLTSITSLSLGNVTSATVNATGVIATITATQVAAGNITAGAIGMMTVTGNAAQGLVGNLTANIHLTGATGVSNLALNSLTVAGSIINTTLNADAGNIASIKAGRSLQSFTVNAIDNGVNLGNVGTITASDVNGFTINSRWLSAMNVVANLGAGLFGNVTGANLTFTGNVGGLGLGTFFAAGDVTNSNWTSTGGSITKVSSARTISNSNLTVSDPSLGKLGTLQAAAFNNVDVIARTIGAVNAVGAAATSAASPAIIGNFTGGSILAYDDAGTVASLTTLLVFGSFDTSFVRAERGIGALTVGRTLSNSTVVADATLTSNLNVGRIATFTTGAINNAVISVNTLGLTRVVGFVTPEIAGSGKTFGDVTGSHFTVNGATPTMPVGIASFTVGRNFDSSTIVAPGGMTTFSAGGSIQNGSSLDLENALNQTAGFLTTLTVGSINASTVRVGKAGAWTAGSITGGDLAVLANATTATSTKVLGTLTVAGDVTGTNLDVAASVGTVTINGVVSGSDTLNAGYAAGARLEALNAGAWSQSRLSSNSVTAFNVKGNTARGLAGSVSNSFFDILGNNAGIGIGTFLATGTVASNTFRVSDGDVTSFRVQRFQDSDLLVGFRLVDNNDITQPPTAANWSATNHKIGLFQTTALFSPTDVANSASFQRSNVVAAVLGTVTLSGVNPHGGDVTDFGVAFRSSAGAAAKGSVKINGSATALTPPFSDNEFDYLGLVG